MVSITANQENEAQFPIDEGIRKIRNETDRVAKVVERVDSADWIGFHNPLDVLTQRTGTILGKLKHLRDAGDPDVRDDIRQKERMAPI